jgi:putative spermidine/putrescine transport system permease protein
VKRRVLSLAFRALVFGTYLLLVTPVAIVVLVSVNPRESLVIDLSAPSLRWYAEFFRNANFFDSFVSSLKIATVTAVAGTLLGVPAAYGLVRGTRRCSCRRWRFRPSSWAWPCSTGTTSSR